MKKIFLSKSLMVKIALVLVIILLFEFAVPRPVGAASLGGTLLNPIINLVVYLADGVIQILQSALTTIDESFSYIDITEGKTSFWVKFGLIIAGIAMVAIAIVLPFSLPLLVVAGVATTGAGVYFSIYPQPLEKMLGVLFGKSFVYSNIYITPETIIKNEIQLFSVNFFNTSSISENDNTASLVSTLRTIIAQIYLTVRDIALLAMLIVIIFIAIRLLLALTPKEKSRYKESMVNCVIGMALIIMMHFGMSLLVTGIEMITNSISLSSHMVYDFHAKSENQTDEEYGNEIKEYFESHPDEYNNLIAGTSISVVSDKLYDAVKAGNENAENPVYGGMVLGQDDEGNNMVTVQMSNFTEQARYMCQKLYELDNENKTIETWAHIGWSFVYIMLVILTVAFVILYTKRMLYMAALTMLAPVVGVMYPINRVNGSRAHTLNLWFREYMSLLFIQPFHLFIYNILIGSVMSFAVSNPIYAIGAIAGILIIENLLKKLLGIEDTVIGGLGKAVQDTTRAIKTTEKAATSIARSVGRTAARGATAIAGTATGIAALVSANKNNSSEEESNANRQPRVQNNPGAQNPQLIKQNDPNALPNSNKNVPGTGSNNTKQDINDTNLADDENSNVTTMPGREPLRFGMNDEEVANPDALLAGGNGIDMGAPLQDNVVGSEFLDESTLNMVDDLNGNGTGFNVIDGGRDTGYGDFVLSDGERNIYREDDGTYHMDLDDGTDYQDPMAMAIGGGFVANTIVGSDYNNRTNDGYSLDSNMTTENVLGGVSGDSSLSGTSGSISYTDSTGSQSIPDGNTIRSTVEVEDERSMLKDSFGVWTNPNTPEPSSDERPNLRTVDSGSTSGSSSVNIPTNNTTTTDTTRTRTVDASTSRNVNPNPNISTSTNSGNGGNAGNSNPSGNSGNTGSGGNGTSNGNSGNTGSGGNGTSNGNSGNAGNNNGSSNKQNNMAENILNGLATGAGKTVEVTSKVAKKTASAAGTLVDGVIDTALAAVGGNPGEVLGTTVGSVTKAVTGMEITGSGASPATSQEVVIKRAGRPSQNVQYIVKETGMSLDDARVIEVQCKKHRINDDRNMALVGGVYKKVSESDKKEIFKLSSVLYEMKRNGKSEKEAREVLDNQAHVSQTTKDLLMKMYDKLIR